jgi:hypothetical protein
VEFSKENSDNSATQRSDPLAKHCATTVHFV